MRYLPSIKLMLIPIIIFASFIHPEGDKAPLKKKSENEQYVKFNINNISTFIYRNGQEDNDPYGNSGFIYPKGSYKASIFSSGFVIGGKINNEITIKGNTFLDLLQPGRILENREPENPENPEVRAYRVKRNYKTDDLSSEMADESEIYGYKKSYEEIYAQYEKDWNEWPAEKGAPYEDLNNNGKYEPSKDIPGEPGADQTIWLVGNGLVEKYDYYGGPPLSIEIQITIWGYDAIPPIGNTMFKKYKVINKSIDTLKEAYAFHFSDTEVGDATDDLSGCDTLLNLVYGYNSAEYDAVYNNFPPAVGFMLQQGPLVKGESSDKGKFNGREIPGMKNLPMTSNTYLLKGPYPFYGDPSDREEFYNYMRGLRLDGSFMPVPEQFGGGYTTFPFSGDPETSSGWIDGIITPPGDRRACMSSGPFTLAPADTQEVIYAVIAAGYIEKITNLQAVTQLKKYAKAISENYDIMPNLRELPRPAVDVFENDKKITLIWGEDISKAFQVENYSKNKISFQGYNVYQASSIEPTKDEIIKIATFDIVDGIKRIHHPYYDLDSDSLTYYAAQNGTDSGLKRSFLVEKDYINDTYLRNGSKYYFAVSPYYYSENGITLPSLEMPLEFIEVSPHPAAPGTRYGAEEGSEIEVEHAFGSATNLPRVHVANPQLLNGHQYEITFNVDELDSVYWSLQDITSGANLYYGNVPYSAYSNPGIMKDGMNIIVEESYKGMSGYEISGTRYLSWAGASGYRLEGFNGAMGWSSPRQYFGDGKQGVSARSLKRVLLRFAKAGDADSSGYNPIFDLADPNLSYAYRYGRNFDKPIADSRFTPFVINQGEGFVYQDYTVSVPFSAWDINDPVNPRKLSIAFIENNVKSGLVDGKYWPPPTYHSNTDDISACEWVWILDEDYSETPNANYIGNAIELDIPAMYWITATSRSYDWGNSEFTIIPHKLFSEEDVYQFTAPETIYNSDLAKEDAERINVFPNPYYSSHSEEKSRYESFVTFSHLPQKAVIRIFNLGGQLVKTIRKDNASTFERWDLRNEAGLQAASGLFLVHIELPELGKSKILKLCIVQRQIVPERF